MSKQKKVLLFGAGGLAGLDLQKRAPPHVAVVAIKSRADVDLSDFNSVQQRVESEKPDWVVNAAAFSDVDGCERDAEKAELINSLGPRNLVAACKSLDIPLIHFSTDYVFSGRKSSVCTEEDWTDPINAYGRSKAHGEENVRRWSRHYILRVSALYGLGRANHALRVLQAIKDRSRVKIFTDLLCSPTYTADLADWIYKLIDRRPDFGIYHLTNAGFCSRYAFAERLCELSGAEKPYPLERVETASLHLPAERPLRVQLSTVKWEKIFGRLPPWEEGLTRFFDEVRMFQKLPG